MLRPGTTVCRCDERAGEALGKWRCGVFVESQDGRVGSSALRGKAMSTPLWERTQREQTRTKENEDAVKRRFGPEEDGGPGTASGGSEKEGA